MMNMLILYIAHEDYKILMDKDLKSSIIESIDDTNGVTRTTLSSTHELFYPYKNYCYGMMITCELSSYNLNIINNILNIIEKKFGLNCYKLEILK